MALLRCPQLPVLLSHGLGVLTLQGLLALPCCMLGSLHLAPQYDLLRAVLGTHAGKLLLMLLVPV